MMTNLSATALALLISAAAAFAAPVITVKDKAGRSMDIEVSGVTGDRVSFTRTSDGKIFQLPLNTFDAESVERITAAKGEAATSHPPYIVDLVVEKRRKKDGYYMVTQTVAAKVTVKNPADLAAPPASVRVVYLGEDRRTGKAYSVLAVRDYKIELPAGKSDVRELDPFTTRYDSDNKGDGNIGGVQYDGYLLLILNAAGEIVQHECNSAKLNEVIKRDPAVRVPFKTIAANADLDLKFAPTGRTALLRR